MGNMKVILAAPDGFINELKLKYTIRKVSTGGSTKPRTGNSHGAVKPKSVQGNGHRRRSYFTHIHL